MGDRYVRGARHPSLEFALRRIGIGHNGGPPLDASGAAWAWRRAVAEAWKPPPREVALRRLARAERLGLTYRDVTAALMNTGVNPATAILPVHHAVLLRRYGAAGSFLFPMPAMADRVVRFRGRLLFVLDPAGLGPCDRPLRREIETALAARFGGRADILGTLPAGDPQRVAAGLRRLLRRRAIPHQEAFYLGACREEQAIAEAAGLALFKWIDGWFAGGT